MVSNPKLHEAKAKQEWGWLTTATITANLASKVKGEADSGKVKGTAEEIRGRVKGEAEELKGKAKGAAEEAEGKVKGNL